MAEINLLRRYPRAKRNIEKRTGAQSERISVSPGNMGATISTDRDTGYGGYRYDGRWVPIAEDMIAHFGLRPGDRVLDVGAGKGFLVKDFMKACPGVNAGEKMHRQAGVKMHQWMP
jgi:2-polyprenyl-3-methyl-5-hydroxy-6-metoxy-1,4-benzoquinol methylase